MTHAANDDDLLRDELRRALEPGARDVERQRTRFEEAVTARPKVRQSPNRRSWRPRRGFALATAATAAAVLVAISLQPGSEQRDGAEHSTGDDRGLRLVTRTAGGAFGGLDLASASAADVLNAAASSATRGIGAPAAGDWTYRRTESRGNEMLETTLQKWTSPDGEREFSIIATTVKDAAVGPPGRSVVIHVEELRRGVIGDVAWAAKTPGGRIERRAMWATDAGTDSGDIGRMVDLRDRLATVRTSIDVQRALDEVIAGSELEFRGGSACEGPQGPCGSYGTFDLGPRTTPEQSEHYYKVGMLLSTLSSVVLPERATRAGYGYLAALDGAKVEPAKDGSGDVLLTLRVPGPELVTRRVGPRTKASYEARPVPGTTEHDEAVALIDAGTGRIVQLNPKPGVGDISYRDVEVGLANGPGVGGPLCEEFADACAELHDLARRQERDPGARFAGARDPRADRGTAAASTPRP